MAKVQSQSPLDINDTYPDAPATITAVSADASLSTSLGAGLNERNVQLLTRRRFELLAELVNDRRNDVLLLDLRQLPVSARIELGRQLRVCRSRTTIPVIGLYDSTMSQEARVAALGDGFWDLVELPDGVAELVAKLANWVWLKRNVDGLQSAMLLDVETGHYTSQGIKRRLREVVALAQRTGAPLSSVIFAADPPSDGGDPHPTDLERLGRKFSLALHHGTRNSDMVGRLEPLKFLVLAPNTPLNGGVRLAERFTSLSWSRRVEGDFPLTFSAGTASVGGRNGQIQACPELLLAAAVRALNQAMSQGSAQVASAWGPGEKHVERGGANP